MHTEKIAEMSTDDISTVKKPTFLLKKYTNSLSLSLSLVIADMERVSQRQRLHLCHHTSESVSLVSTEPRDFSLSLCLD